MKTTKVEHSKQLIMDIVESKEYRNHEIDIYLDECPDIDDPRTWDNTAVFAIDYRGYNFGDRHDVSNTIEEYFWKYVKPKDIIELFKKDLHAVKRVDEDGDWYYDFEMEDENHEIHHESVSFWASWDEYSEDVARELVNLYFTDKTKLKMLEDTNKVAFLPISLYDHSGITMWLGSKEGHVDARWDCSSVGYAFIEYDEKRFGKSKDWKQEAYDIMSSEMKVYNDYVSGEIYGWEIKDEDGNRIDSCGGYFGSDSFDSMFEEAKAKVDANIKAAAEERKKNIQMVYGNLTKMHHTYYVLGSLYRVGQNMFDQPILERAKIVDGVVTPFVEPHTLDLSDDEWSELASKIKIA